MNVTRLMGSECLECQQCDFELNAGRNREPLLHVALVCFFLYFTTSLGRGSRPIFMSVSVCLLACLRNDSINLSVNVTSGRGSVLPWWR